MGSGEWLEEVVSGEWFVSIKAKKRFYDETSPDCSKNPFAAFEQKIAAKSGRQMLGAAYMLMLQNSEQLAMGQQIQSTIQQIHHYSAACAHSLHLGS